MELVRIKDKGNKEIKYSYILPISREWMVDELFSNILEIHVWQNTELLVYLDSDSPEFLTVIIEKCKLLSDKFEEIRIIYSAEKPHQDYGRVIDRRQRVLKIHSAFKQHLEESRLIFGQEDDTICPKEAFDKLMAILKKDVTIAYAQGITKGRWGIDYLPAWKIKIDENKEVQEIETGEFKEKGIEDVQGGGFFCFAVRTTVYKETKMQFGEEPEGPDVRFVLDIVRTGYRAVTDWAINCEHHTETGIILRADNNYRKITWKKYGNKLVRWRE